MCKALIALQTFALDFEKVLSFINPHYVIYAPRILLPDIFFFFGQGYFEVSHLENPNPWHSCLDQGWVLFST